MSGQFDDLTPSKLKDHFTLLTIHKSKSDNEIIYHPVQAKQFCYIDATFNVQCRVVDAKHTPMQDSGNSIFRLLLFKRFKILLLLY